MVSEKVFLVALGKEPADLLLKNARLVDVISGEIRRGELAVAEGYVVGFGARKARQVVDLRGKYLAPGFIDTHVHLESSQVTPPEFARAVLPRGTTCLIADPHEIANVLGQEGIRYLLDATASLPLRCYFMAPACVPASPWETAGAELGAREIAEILRWERVLGLGEFMNFPGVLAREEVAWAKLKAAQNRPIDGHAPGLSGAELWAYVLAGPRTDHEATALEEAREKLACGVHVLIREGTTARNLLPLLPLLTPHTAPFVHFCTDDRHPETLLSEGHLDGMLRQAIARGVPPLVACAAATLHAARAFRLWDLGALAPGYRADFTVLSDLEQVRIEAVYVGGELVAREGECLVPLAAEEPAGLRATVRVNPEQLSFSIPARGKKARVIGVVPGQVFTRALLVSPKLQGGEVVADPARDLLKLAVVERHRGTGNVGLGLVQGFGLRAGALASTVAHDAHNLVVVGASDEDMRRAVAELVRLGGGQVVVAGGEVQAALPLPIAGLMSDRRLEEVARLGRELVRAAHGLGCILPDPFMTLSFLALPVIPALKLTDRGLVDVEAFQLVPLFVA